MTEEEKYNTLKKLLLDEIDRRIEFILKNDLHQTHEEFSRQPESYKSIKLLIEKIDNWDALFKGAINLQIYSNNCVYSELQFFLASYRKD